MDGVKPYCPKGFEKLIAIKTGSIKTSAIKTTSIKKNAD